MTFYTLLYPCLWNLVIIQCTWVDARTSTSSGSYNIKSKLYDKKLGANFSRNSSMGQRRKLHLIRRLLRCRSMCRLARVQDVEQEQRADARSPIQMTPIATPVDPRSRESIPILAEPG